MIISQAVNPPPQDAGVGRSCGILTTGLPMYDRDKVEKLSQKRAQWQQGGDNERPGPFMTTSGRPIRRLYYPTDIAELDYERDLGPPGEYPYTRGIHATGYRGKMWTMRMFAGFGSAEETNARFKYLLS